MGTWGPTNFENDWANDYLGIFLDKLITEIREKMLQSEQKGFLEYHGEYEVIPAIDIYLTLSESYDAPPRIDRSITTQWRQAYLQAFDRSTTMYPKGFKLERRKAIEETFDRLDKFLNDWPE